MSAPRSFPTGRSGRSANKASNTSLMSTDTLPVTGFPTPSTNRLFSEAESKARYRRCAFTLSAACPLSNSAAIKSPGLSKLGMLAVVRCPAATTPFGPTAPSTTAAAPACVDSFERTSSACFATTSETLSRVSFAIWLNCGRGKKVKFSAALINSCLCKRFIESSKLRIVSGPVC